MKILHCLTNFLPHQVGGTEIYVAALCNELQNLGVEVVVVNPSFGVASTEYIYSDIPVKQYLETSIASAALQVGLEAPKGILNFKQLVLKENPDAIHFHEMAGSNGITIYHLMVAKELGVHIFTTFHLSGNICMRSSFLYKGQAVCNGKVNEYKCSVCMLQKKHLPIGMPEAASFLGYYFKKEISETGIGKLFNYPLYVKRHLSNLHSINKLSGKMFVLSNWYKGLLEVNGLNREKIVVLPAAVPKPKTTATASAGYNIQGNDKLKFVYAGRITEIKGLHILLDALKNIKHQNWELDIWGSISEKEYYNTCVQKIAGNASITWKGVTTNEEMISTLKAYDALIFPSIVQETMGLIMLESFAAGVPVIGSSIWSVNEQITEGVNGMIFKMGDSVALQSVLETILNDPSLLPKMAKKISTPLYMDEVAKATLLAYEEILTVQ